MALWKLAVRFFTTRRKGKKVYGAVIDGKNYYIDDAKKQAKEYQEYLQAKAQVNKLKNDISKLASMGNKRLRRLEKQGLTESPAYQKWVEQGGEYFSVKNKSWNELQKELARIRQFTNAKTSTVRGLNQQLKDMASATGIKYKKVSELQAKSKQFFKLADMVEQYIRSTEGTASHLGYQPIWQAINETVKKEKLELGNVDNNLEEITKKVSELLKYERIEEKYKNQFSTKSFTYF